MILWKVHDHSPKLASIRYRCLLPLFQLQKIGYDSIVFSRKDENIWITDEIDAMIFVKSFEVKDLILAQKAHLKQIPVILDICDNIFLPTYQNHKKIRMHEVFWEMAKLASMIVTPTKSLAEIIQVKGNLVPVKVIPDTADDVMLTKIILAVHRRNWIKKLIYSMKSKFSPNQFRPTLKWQRYRLRKKGRVLTTTFVHGISKNTFTKGVSTLPKLNAALFNSSKIKSIKTIEPTDSRSSTYRHPSQRAPKRIIWFGNHGAKHSEFGIKDILFLKDQLILISQEYEVELLVVSNSYSKFRKYISPLPFSTQYQEWDPIKIFHWLSISDVAIIPNPQNDFTRCKSANRAVTALKSGVPVIATKTSALEIFENCIIFDDWSKGFKTYFSYPEIAQQHLKSANTIIEKEMGIEQTGQNWKDVLNFVHSPHLSPQKKLNPTSISNQPQKLGFFIGLVQDLDVLLPLVLHYRENDDFRPKLFVNQVALEKSPRVWKKLLEHQLAFRVLTNFELIWDHQPDLSDLVGFVTGSESNKNVHRAAHVLTERANTLGIPTYTLQHGLENIGLTYSDGNYPIHSVTFHSRHILTWGPRETLNANVRPEVRERCHSIGIPKPVEFSVQQIKLLEQDKPIIGIFENLHWERYDKVFINYFLNHLKETIQSFPNLIFILKPHPAGHWFSTHKTGHPINYENFILADPQNTEWSTFSAQSIMQYCQGIITTPSTIALDAARMSKPVAIAGYQLDLSRYAPLNILRNSADWIGFLQNIQDSNNNSFFKQISLKFVENNLVPGDGLERTHQLITSTCLSSPS